MNLHAPTRTFARGAAIILIACAPARLTAQQAARTSQTVTFAVVPVHTFAAAQTPATQRAEKVTVGSVSSAGMVVAAAPAPAAQSPLRVPRQTPHPKPAADLIITVTE